MKNIKEKLVREFKELGAKNQFSGKDLEYLSHLAKVIEFAEKMERKESGMGEENPNRYFNHSNYGYDNINRMIPMGNMYPWYGNSPSGMFYGGMGGYYPSEAEWYARGGSSNQGGGMSSGGGSMGGSNRSSDGRGGSQGSSSGGGSSRQGGRNEVADGMTENPNPGRTSMYG